MDTYTTLPSVKQGDTWQFVFTFRNGNTPIDLSDCTAKMQVRNRKTKILLAEVSTANQNMTIEGTLGQVTAIFPADQTSLVPAGTHYSDVEVTFIDTGYVMSSQTVQIPVEEDITE